MAQGKKSKIHIDDLHLGEQDRAFHASWIEAGLVAEITLDIVALNHWQHGQYRARSYELSNATHQVGEEEVDARREETARMFLRQLHARLLTAMLDAGWREVARTRDNEPIYQYRPPLARLSEAEREEVAAAFAELDQAEDLEDLAGEHPSKLYEVYGSYPKEHGPAYTRRVTAKTVTFSCAICGSPVTRECYPGQLPRYCGSEDCRREAVRLRVEKHRANKQTQE